jgi:hypothetical protein
MLIEEEKARKGPGITANHIQYSRGSATNGSITNHNYNLTTLAKDNYLLRGLLASLRISTLLPATVAILCNSLVDCFALHPNICTVFRRPPNLYLKDGGQGSFEVRHHGQKFNQSRARERVATCLSWKLSKLVDPSLQQIQSSQHKLDLGTAPAFRAEPLIRERQTAGSCATLDSPSLAPRKYQRLGAKMAGSKAPIQ